MPTAATKLSVVGGHTCASKQVREYTAKPKGEGTVAPRPKRTMTDAGSIQALFQKYGIDTVDNDDETMDIDKTMRQIKHTQDEPTFMAQLRRNKKYAAVIVPMLQKAQADHEDAYSEWDPEAEDPDDRPPPFDENVVLWQLMPAILSAETKDTHKDKIIAGLRVEKDQMEEQVEQCKLETARVKGDYEFRLHNLCERYNELLEECNKYRAEAKKGDTGDLIAHL